MICIELWVIFLVQRDNFRSLKLLLSNSFGFRQIFIPKYSNIRILGMNEYIHIRIRAKFNVMKIFVFVFVQNGYFEYIRYSYSWWKMIFVTHWSKGTTVARLGYIWLHNLTFKFHDWFTGKKRISIAECGGSKKKKEG